jgi:hypothetical protein
MNTFTVICLYPEYATEDYGTDTVIRTVEASNAFEASGWSRESRPERPTSQSSSPSDFQVIAVFPGHVRPALEARHFRTPA